MAETDKPLISIHLLDSTRDKQSLARDELFFLYQIDVGWYKKVDRFLDTPEKRNLYLERLREELNVILKMKFASYFLIVQDMLLWCDKNKIRRGPGRGSAAGSLLAYLLDITKIEPIRYGLLFSRFLNADRISMPDIDNDIETDRREEVKQYLAIRYGQDRVASIGTFGTTKLKSGVKDIIRSLNIGGSKSEAFVLADQINNLVPDDAEIEFDAACKQVPELKGLIWYPNEEELAAGWQQRINAGEKPSRFWEVGYHLRKMEGMIRQTGTHAAGVVISPTPLAQILPMAIDKNDVIVTANSGKMVEDAGFLKIDVLGLNTLSIIEKCIRNIEKTRGYQLKGLPTVGVEVLPDESEASFKERISKETSAVQEASKAYRLLRSGRTSGIFQNESVVAQQLLKDLQANSIDDISVVLALNRPGPLKAGLVTEYGDRKFNRIHWELPHPSTAKVLSPTYGVLAYQEQCMQLAADCAGFTMVESDTLRKAIGKKMIDLMVKFKEKFINGCYQHHKGFDVTVEYETFEEDSDGNPIKIKRSGTIAERLWNDIVFFAGYGFNKSHSVSYGTVSYQTAFLKANFPAEFWAAQLSYETDQVKINKMIIEAKSDGTKVLPVSVNTSSLGYESETPTTVRRSLGTLKSVGKVAIAELVRCRPYASVPEFIMKTDGRKINKKTVQALISAGAFDEFGIPRRTLSLKIDDCKAALDKFVKKKFEAYAKAAGVRKGCLTTPVELDLELIANTDLSKIENNEKLLRAKEIAVTLYAEWLKTRPTIDSGEYETVDEAIKVTFKKVMKQWVHAFSKIVMENEWTYNFIEQDVDKVEWTLSELITAEKLVYGTAVSAHIFDQHPEVEKRVMERYPTNFYTFDSGIDQLSNGFEIVAMVEVVGLDRQFPYKKDPTKFTRLFKVEDRFGAGELTVFDKSYDDFVQDEKGTPVRVWRVGNILVVKAKMNVYGARKSLVYDKCLKLVASK